MIIDEKRLFFMALLKGSVRLVAILALLIVIITPTLCYTLLWISAEERTLRIMVAVVCITFSNLPAVGRLP